MIERAMDSLYPPIEPFEGGGLQLTGGHCMAWQRCGNPEGYPVLVLHGGPGGSVQPYYRQLINPNVFCGVFYDQRGCGRSTPIGELDENDLPALVEDIECLRRYLGVDRWMVLGGSWGSTLGLAYAESHPQAVSALVLTGIFLAREVDRLWTWGGARTVYPDAWDELVSTLPEDERVAVRENYLRRVLDLEPSLGNSAGIALMKYEATLLNPEPDLELLRSVTADTSSTVRMARIYCHYDRQHYFLKENQLIDEAGALAGIPGRIINGRLDMCTPSHGALDLSRAWPDARLQIVEMAGHRWSDRALAPVVVAALNELYQQVGL